METILNYERIEDKPFLIMMCGLPGSGKSTFAENSIIITSGVEQYKPIIHSSDGLRKELYGDESITSCINVLKKTLSLEKMLFMMPLV